MPLAQGSRAKLSRRTESMEITCRRSAYPLGLYTNEAIGRRLGSDGVEAGEKPEDAARCFDEARRQAELYAVGSLAGFELTSYRYAVVVSQKRVAPPDDCQEGNVTHRHADIAVDRDAPSRASKGSGGPRVGKHNMFEISGADIAALGDEDLRTLVARLCEAEMWALQLPASAVTWGGDQNAADGGLDVRVDLPEGTVIQGFVPRAATGFQVKKPDMPPKEITKEMRPNGKLRPVIRELAKRSGAYIIISSKGSVSDSALGNRRETMAAAVKGVKGNGKLGLEFYDRNRIATWVRSHPGLVLWVRQRIGRSLQGWRSYGAWAYRSEEGTASYLLDEKLRIRRGSKEGGKGVSAADGLTTIRDILHEPRKVVRLVGLSGVGKTRFVQALFDSRAGDRSLDPSLAMYCDMGDDPDPQPVALASNLIASKARSILVIDNCPPDLHRRLSETCRTAGSLLSLITIEYDIRDDDPEETDVYRLEASSDELIEKLIRARFGNISQVDAKTIATFSGGNARLAIALAGTIKKNETVAGLTDENLFLRLFHQRHSHDESLQLIGQACSLVYSFHGEGLTGKQAELPVFASLIGKSVDEVFRGVANLRRRDMVQQRGVWRAVLPHALANRLASRALQDIPLETIKAELVDGGSPRLLKSFSRRLGYLHDNEVAVRIVHQWLAAGGLLSDLRNLGVDEMVVFENIAPVDPEGILTALEGVTPASLSRRDSFARIVRLIGYDPALFERSVELLVQYGAAETERSGRSGSGCQATPLFYIILSGTHASIEQRLKVVEALLRSGDEYRRTVGAEALHHVLEAWQFSSGSSFEFGARPRDYGLWPKTNGDVTHWYNSALKLVESLALSDLPAAGAVRMALASQLRGLWRQRPLHGEIDRVCRAIAAARFWREGWIGVCQTLKYDFKGIADESKAKLVDLEKVLRPKDLVQKVRGLVLSPHARGLDIDDADYDGDEDIATSLDRTTRMAEMLGRDVVNDAAAFAKLLPEMVSGQGGTWYFGSGLATGADDPATTWRMLVSQFVATPGANRNPRVLRGYLEGLSTRDDELTQTLLDEAVTHDVLAGWFPDLQTGVTIDTRAIGRLQQSLTLNEAPVDAFRNLALGRSSDSIPGPDLKGLVLAIAKKDGGFDVAVEILYMRLFSDKDAKKPVDRALVEAGREILGAVEFNRYRQDSDHRVESLIQSCLTGAEGTAVAEALCRKLITAISGRETYAFAHALLLKGLFQVQPSASLEAFFGGGRAERSLSSHIILEASHHHGNVLDCVPSDVLIAWCDRKPDEHYPFMAGVMSVYVGQEDQGGLEWSSAFLAILDRAPDRVAVLNQLAERFRPRSWSGSLAIAMQTRLPLWQKLESYPDPAVGEFARSEGSRFGREIEKVRQEEAERDKSHDERFE